MNENRKKSTKKARPRKVSKRSDSTDLRNQFAAAALGGILSDPNVRRGNWVDGYRWPEDYDEFCETVVSSALSYADALLAAFAKAKGGVSVRRSIDDHNLLLSIENASEIAAKAGHGDPTPEELEAARRHLASVKERARKNLEIALAAIDRRNPGTPPTRIPGGVL